jgi:hypothetical protein
VEQIRITGAPFLGVALHPPKPKNARRRKRKCRKTLGSTTLLLRGIWPTLWKESQYLSWRQIATR